MLTEREKKWLRQRELFQYYYCNHCEHKPLCKDYNFIIGVCPTLRHPEDWQDAVEFSERVAARLAENTDVSIKAICQAGIHGKSIAWANLKIARLQVEEEMDEKH